VNNELIVKRDGPRPWDAKVFGSNGEEVARIMKGGGLNLKLRSTSGDEWVISNNVNGRTRAFSLSFRKSNKDDDNNNNTTRLDPTERIDTLTIQDNIFKHNGKFYMLANHPEGKKWQDHVNSAKRYISRLDNFPYSDLAEVELQHQSLRQKLKRFRGVPVGEATGLGVSEQGHRVIVNDELGDIALPLAAASYLIYSSA
jgi:hypothetical protein